ncbi:MAG: M28 family peptidase [Saprospiraceae bacterium]|nr:M28 family peptidase [Saprospiraceae bacterium]
MKKSVVLLFWILSRLVYANQLPILEHCYSEFKNGVITIYYDLADPDNHLLEIRCAIFNQQNRNKIAIKNAEGDIGANVATGANKSIRLSFEDPSLLPADIVVHLSAHDGEKLNVGDLIAGVNRDSILHYLNQLQGKRNAVTDPVFLNKTRDDLLGFSSLHLLSRKIEGRLPQGQLINIEATQWGCEHPEQVQIIDAHYDSFGQSPGADDNGSGVAGVMEAMRILSPLYAQKTIRYLFFDLEESGLLGSQFYLINQLNPNDLLQNCINFEMIGYYSDQPNTQDLPAGFNILFPDVYNQVIANQRRGDFITNVGNVNSSALVDAFANAAIEFVPVLKVMSLKVPGNGTLTPDLRRSDHASFWDRNIPALMITDAANFRNKNYHTIRDSVHTLDLDFIIQIIKTTIAAMVQLSGIEHAAASSMELHLGTANKDASFELPKIYWANGILNIEAEENSPEIILNCFDSNGHLIKSSQLKPGHSLKWSNDGSPGIYFLCLRNHRSQKTYQFFWQ